MMHHYTNKKGFNAIRASLPWHFNARKPPGRHPVGAYFTDLPRWTPKLAKQLRIPSVETRYVFIFTDIGDLIRLRGGRGQHIFYSPQDYDVDRARQQYEGLT